MSDGPKKLKIVQKGFQNLTGPIGMYQFVDGVSVEAITRSERDRLSAVFSFNEIDEDGEEEPAGIAHRLVAERSQRAPEVAGLERVTEAEHRAEIKRLIVEALTAGAREVKTREELENILASAGIEGLRAIGEMWKVKDRNAIVLIEKILAAQELYTAKKDAKTEAILSAEGALEVPVSEDPVSVDAAVGADDEATVDDATAAKLEAAMSGDLSKALTQE